MRAAIFFGLWIGGLLLDGGALAQRPGATQVRVFGQADRDRMPWRKHLTVFDVTVLSRPRDDADLETVFVLRAEGARVSIFEIDVATMLRSGDTARNVVIQPGDAVVFPIQIEKGVTRRVERRVFDELRLVELESGADVPAKERARIERERLQLLAWRLATDFDDRRRQRLATELGMAADKAATAVPHLVDALRGKIGVAGAAATALGLIGAPAKAALPALERLGKSDDRALQARARAAVRQIRRALERR